MGARKKLNSAAIMGALVLAGVIGFLTDSWIVFILAALILLGLSFYQGDIRRGKRDW